MWACDKGESEFWQSGTPIALARGRDGDHEGTENTGDTVMKKMMLLLGSGILGSLLMLGSQDAEARNHRSYRGSSRSVYRTVVHRSYRTTVVPTRRYTRVIHRPVVHRVHVPARRVLRYVTRYSLRPALSTWAYSRLNGYYYGNVDLFCAAYPGYCFAASQPVYYGY